MLSTKKMKASAGLLSLLLSLPWLAPLPAGAIDTDIYTAGTSAAAPNVLIVLDNTSNWSRNNQFFPDPSGKGTITQGQAEVAAIKQVIQSLTGYVNVGLLEFVTGGPAGDDGGYIRYAISPMGSSQTSGPANQKSFAGIMDKIYGNITGSTEKTNSGMGYGNLMYDAYNYFAGAKPFASSGDVVSSLADSNGYTTTYTQFKSPLSADNLCAHNFIIFIGNPPAKGPTPDVSANTNAMKNLGGDTSQLPLLQFAAATQTISTDLGYSPFCSSSQPTTFDSAHFSLCPQSKNDPNAAYASCSYSTSDTTTSLDACPSGTSHYLIRRTANGKTTDAGPTAACYSSAPTGTPTYDYDCSSKSVTCSYGPAMPASTAICGAGAMRYQAQGISTGTVTTPTSPPTYKTDTGTYNADEWARFMYQKGVSVPNSTVKASAATFTIDVYHNAPDPVQSSLLTSMATNGGGRYFAATTQQQIVLALKSIFGEILAVNSAFASAALPISATNRTVNRNEVYIGMFRPDQQSMPRWFGNLKRYQFGVVSGTTQLVDAKGLPAVSTSSGFVTPCAQSFWTTDLGNYWANVNSSTGTVSPRVFFTTATSAGTAWTTQGDENLLAKGLCDNTAAYSDLPDGPVVEKGGVAEQVRSAKSRTVKTLSGTSVVDFNTTNVTNLSSNATVNANIVNFIRGQDVTGEINGTSSASNRPSIHGDVIHSRPLAVDFGGTVGVKAYYGANDGVYRAVNATTGAEEWAFVAPQSYASLQRLLDNSPAVQTPSPTPPNVTASPGKMKDFFFDGSTGLYQNSDSSTVWIYPTMRRGGRMLYAFDVSPGAAPASVKWVAGCDDSGCTDSNLSNMGQTWSTPNVAFLPGYSTSVPVVVMGGGYDTCEDADSNPSAAGFCANPKGAGVYVFDGDRGTLIASFTTDRSVAGDVAFVDMNLDGNPDLAYVADTGGNIYRINFSDPAKGFAPLSPSKWTSSKVAYTNGASRKFLFAPAVLAYKNQVYLAIGSGDREHPTADSYPFTMPVTNRFYVYLDDPLRTTVTDLDGINMYNHTDSSLDTCNYEPVLPGGEKYGWYMDLSQDDNDGHKRKGEQTVTSALISQGRVTFSTNRPFGSTANTCANPLGEASGYWLNLLNGSGAIGVSGSCGGARSSVFVGGGLPPSPVSGVVSINGVPQTVIIGAVQADGSTSSPIGGQKARPPIKAKRKRIYWHTATDTH